MIADGVVPSNTDRGYILRRILRRAIFNTKNKSITQSDAQHLVEAVSRAYQGTYPEINATRDAIVDEIRNESEKFEKTLAQGLRMFENLRQDTISGRDAFILFSTYGFPFELTEELAREKGIEVDREEFEKEMSTHQETSRAGAEQKFKGGLADTSEMSVKYHTATHLLNSIGFSCCSNSDE
jgi:alanyl-tRNA synthetase